LREVQAMKKPKLSTEHLLLPGDLGTARRRVVEATFCAAARDVNDRRLTNAKEYGSSPIGRAVDDALWKVETLLWSRAESYATRAERKGGKR
jgi:hypothetical protein